VSPETLLEPTLVDPTPNLNPNQPFDPDSFNSYVMNTYGRFPIAIAKGLGCLLWDTSGKHTLILSRELPPVPSVTRTLL